MLRICRLALALVVLAEPAAAHPPRTARRALDVAEQLFREGRYRETLAQLERVPANPDLRPRVWLLGAMASYKLDDLRRADQLARQVMDRGFYPQAALLRGMVAFRREQWDAALQYLREVVAVGEEPLNGEASRLMGEVEVAKKAAARRAFDAAISKAQRLIGEGRLEEVDRELDRAERLRPGEVPTRYYRGLVAYRRREYRAAEYYLKAAIALDRRDSWSTYMLALTRGELGDAPGARARLEALARSSPDPAVRATASRALQALDRTQRASRHHLDARVEAGSALDTNPAYVDESSASLQDAALALHVAGRLSYQHRASDLVHIGGGLRLLERNYAVGDQGAASTELDVALSLLASGGAVRLGVFTSYLFQLYGHQPFCSVPASELQLSVGLRSWLAALIGAHLSYRLMHNGDYEHLQALTVGGSLGARGSWNKVSLELTYFVQHGGSPEVTRSFTGASSVAYRLATDYSAWGHGPRLALLARLPWRLRLFASVGLALRHFSAADTLVRSDTGAAARLDARRDETLAVDAELARALPRGFEVALRFESVDNFSTTRRTDPIALDYNYSRRLAGLVLGWTWPVSAGP